MDTEMVVLIVTAVVAAISLGFSVITYARTLRRDRKQATLDAFTRLQEQAFDPLNQFAPAAIREIVRHPTSPEYKKLSGYVARIEHFCVGVVCKIYDRKTVYSLAHGYLDGSAIRRRLEPILDRKNSGTDEEYYHHIHEVLRQMEERASR